YVTVNIGPAVPPTTTSFQASGTDGTITHTFNMQLKVSDFSISASPSTIIAQANSSGNSTVTVTSINGFNSAVDLACTGLPGGASCSFAPTPVTPPANSSANSDLTVTTGAIADGDYPFQITGSEVGLVHSFDMTLYTT